MQVLREFGKITCRAATGQGRIGARAGPRRLWVGRLEIDARIRMHARKHAPVPRYFMAHSLFVNRVVTPKMDESTVTVFIGSGAVTSNCGGIRSGPNEAACARSTTPFLFRDG